MIVRPYLPEMKSEWDSFVRSSRNGTFLFCRDYMDYHSDRFPDASLVAYDDKGRLVALLPATIGGYAVSSHAGLTYGGWILGPKAPDMLGMMHLWPAMMEHYRSLGCDTLIYKPVPHIYHRYPSEEDLYALFRFGASLDRTLVSSVVDFSNPVAPSATVSRHARNAARQGLVVAESGDFPAFWSMLSERLSLQYSARPVHSLDEIERLHRLFPDYIKLYVVTGASGRMLAGTVLFLCGQVAKTQYIASSAEGCEVNANDHLFLTLLSRAASRGYRYFDFGTSNEDGGRYLNEGLIFQKICYGGRGIVYNTFRQPL